MDNDSLAELTWLPFVESRLGGVNSNCQRRDKDTERLLVLELLFALVCYRANENRSRASADLKSLFFVVLGFSLCFVGRGFQHLAIVVLLSAASLAPDT